LINEAFQVAEFLALDKDEQFAYQLDLKTHLDYKNVMDYAKEEAEKKGIEKGIEIGKAENRDVVRKEVREEERIVFAKKLLDVLDTETIAQKTGLSIERVNKLKLQLK
jgi:predicted transposase YdaD